MEAKELGYGIAYAYLNEVNARGKKIDGSMYKPIALAIAEQMTDKEDKRFGLMLAGTVGTGKTTFAMAIQRVINRLAQLLSNETNMDYPFKGCRLVGAKEVLILARDGIALSKLKEDPILIIDDFGEEPTESMSYGNVATPIVDILEYRYNYRLYTILTTNLTSEQIESKYGLRLRDRLREMCKMITITNTSYR